MKIFSSIILFVCGLFCVSLLQAQTKDTASLKLSTDSSVIVKTKKDTLVKRNHIPRIATIRSAILPGLGQAYNHEYWKIPIVYAALAIPVFTFIYNDKYYKMTKYAYQAEYRATYLGDSSGLSSINPQVKNLDLSSLQNYENEFRRDMDYSILWFLILWGVNVADATVFGHLKEFNVSNDLSMRVNPSYTPYTKSTGVSFVLNFKNKPSSNQVKATTMALF